MKQCRLIICSLYLALFSVTAFAAGHSAHASKQKLININQAKMAELAKVDGMSASKARAIVAYRKSHGKFKSIEELNKVKGFKRLKSEKLQAITQQLKL